MLLSFLFHRSNFADKAISIFMKKLTGKKLSTVIFLFLVSVSVTVFANDPEENSGIIKGKLTTNDGKPAGSVTVQLKGTKKYTTTNDDGTFSLRAQPGEYTIEVSLIGYETVTQYVTVENNKTINISIQLHVSEKQLQEVVVSSNRNKYIKNTSDYVAKIPLKNLENPQVYTTVTKELINEQLVFSVDDATKNTPGLQKMWEATGRGGDGGAYYNSRGFILQSQLRNGVAGNVTSRIDAANIESIEVIKGPSATLFGSTLTSYGGLINRITKKPYATFGGEVSYAAGSYGFNRIAADVNTPLDAAKNVLLRVNTAYSSEGSFQDNGFEKGYVIAPSLSYKVNDKLSFLFDAELYGGSNSSKQIIFFYYPASQLGATSADQLGIDYKRSYSSNDIYQTSKSNNFFGQMNYKLSDKWTSQTNFTSSYSFSDGPYAYFYLIPNTNRPGADSMVRADQSTANSQMQVTEIQQNFIGEFNVGTFRNRMVAGLDYFAQNSNQFFYGANFDVIPKNGDIPTYSSFNKDNLNAVLQNKEAVWTWPYEFKSNTYSAYVSDVINITEKLIAMAALRVDRFDNKGKFDEATGKYSGAYKQTTFSPKFGAVYQIVEDRVSLFANYQNGFTNKQGTDYKGNTFKPEHANQLEGGVKVNAFNGKLNTTLSYYDIQVKNIIRTYTGDIPDPSNPNPQIQDGTQVSKGFEAEVIASPLRGLNIVTGFAYNYSKLIKADDDVKGRRPATAMSPYAANLWISYHLQGAMKGLGFGFGGNYASDNKILNSVYYGEFILPAYTVLNAAVFYDHTKFRAGIKVDNLTNKEYWIGYTTMNPQKLRSVVGSIAFKF